MRLRLFHNRFGDFDMDLLSVFELYPDHESCLKHLEKVRWGDKPVCPFCGCLDVQRKHEMRRKGRWKCNACDSSYNVMSGTIFESTKVQLQKWFLAIALILNAKKGVSSYELARSLKLNQKTAWYLAMRIRKGMQEDDVFLQGIVEADETYVNWQKRTKRHDLNEDGDYDRNWRRYKMTFMGAVERKGNVFAELIPNVNEAILTSFLTMNVALSSQLVTDGLTGYGSMADHFARHYVINHDATYVEGEVHTNTIEGFWSLLKRAWHGSHHYYTPRYANAYAAEACYKYNHRKERNLFDKFIQRVMEV